MVHESILKRDLPVGIRVGLDLGHGQGAGGNCLNRGKILRRAYGLRVELLQANSAQSVVFVFLVAVGLGPAARDLCEGELCCVGVEELVLENTLVSWFLHRALYLLLTILRPHRH